MAKRKGSRPSLRRAVRNKFKEDKHMDREIRGVMRQRIGKMPTISRQLRDYRRLDSVIRPNRSGQVPNNLKTVETGRVTRRTAVWLMIVPSDTDGMLRYYYESYEQVIGSIKPGAELREHLVKWFRDAQVGDVLWDTHGSWVVIATTSSKVLAEAPPRISYHIVDVDDKIRKPKGGRRGKK